MSFGVSLHTAVALSASSEASSAAGDLVTTVLVHAHEAAEAGVEDVWFSQGLDVDAITVAALVGREVPGIAVGTAVVPMYPRHPLTLVNQAKTAQLASGGRFLLGIGLGHKATVEGVYGVAFDRPVRHLRDYLRVLRSVFETGTATLHGPTLTADLSQAPAVATASGVTSPIPLLVAAMGPQALRAAGELADGTLPYLAGPRTLAEFIVPTITEAASAAGRPAPRVAVGVPAVVTADVAGAREYAERSLGLYGASPSYRAVLDREGASHPADLALIGDEDTVAAGIRRFVDAGATDVRVSPAVFRTDDDRLRTWRLVGALAREARSPVG